MPCKKREKSSNPLCLCPCKQTIKKSAWIACSNCNQWWHAGCVSLTKEICEIFRKKKLDYKCPSCIISQINDSQKDNTVNNNTSNTESSSTTYMGSQGVEPGDSMISKDNNKIIKTNQQDNIDLPTQINKENFLILDGLGNPSQFRDSRKIKKEIREHKRIDVTIAYALPRGGIAIEASSQSASQKLQEPWPESAFGNSGRNIVTHDISPRPRCVLKNIATYLSTDRVTQVIQEQTGVKAKVRRLHYSDSNKPLRIVVVTCSSFEDLALLHKKDIVVGSSHAILKPYRTKRCTPLRCYSCQQFGHIASICTANHKCVNCGGDHSGICLRKSKCANCGDNHTAASSKCPAFLEIQKRLDSRA